MIWCPARDGWLPSSSRTSSQSPSLYQVFLKPGDRAALAGSSGCIRHHVHTVDGDSTVARRRRAARFERVSSAPTAVLAAGSPCRVMSLTPIKKVTCGGRPTTTRRHGAVLVPLAAAALVDQFELVIRAAHGEEVTQHLRRGLQVVGAALTERDDRRSGRPRQSVDGPEPACHSPLANAITPISGPSDDAGSCLPPFRRSSRPVKRCCRTRFSA